MEENRETIVKSGVLLVAEKIGVRWQQLETGRMTEYVTGLILEDPN